MTVLGQAVVDDDRVDLGVDRALQVGRLLVVVVAGVGDAQVDVEGLRLLLGAEQPLLEEVAGAELAHERDLHALLELGRELGRLGRRRLRGGLRRSAARVVAAAGDDERRDRYRGGEGRFHAVTASRRSTGVGLREQVEHRAVRVDGVGQLAVALRRTRARSASRPGGCR